MNLIVIMIWLVWKMVYQTKFSSAYIDGLILDLLMSKEYGLTRTEIMVETNLPRTTIYDSLQRLQEFYPIQRIKHPNKAMLGRPKTGRPIILWAINNVDKIRRNSIKVQDSGKNT